MSKNKGLTLTGIGKDKKHAVSNPGAIRLKVKSRKQKRTGKTDRFDCAFVFDTTSSMSDKIEKLLDTCVKFVEDFAKLSLDWRIAIVSFGDLYVPKDEIEVVTPFTNEIEVIQAGFRKIPRNNGGGNNGESSFEAVDKALNLPWLPNVPSVIILITDEPAHQDNIFASDMVNRLVQEEVLTFVISPDIPYFRDMAEKTGGKWNLITKDPDLKDLLNKFRETTKTVIKVVADVHKLAGGSVAKHRRLKSPEG